MNVPFKIYADFECISKESKILEKGVVNDLWSRSIKIMFLVDLVIK